MSERIDLLVHGGDVLTVDATGTVVPRGGGGGGGGARRQRGRGPRGRAARRAGAGGGCFDIKPA
ncbi:hypothetical protein ACFV3F_37510, partial [Streptomyces sp. NPDC059717]